MSKAVLKKAIVTEKKTSPASDPKEKKPASYRSTQEPLEVGARVWVWNPKVKPIARKQGIVACINDGKVNVDVMYDDGEEEDEIEVSRVSNITADTNESKEMLTLSMGERVTKALQYKVEGNECLQKGAATEAEQKYIAALCWLDHTLAQTASRAPTLAAASQTTSASSSALPLTFHLPSTPSSSRPARRWQVGDAVRAYREHRSLVVSNDSGDENTSNVRVNTLEAVMWPATIACDNDDNTYDIIFENGEDRDGVEANELFSPFTDEYLGVLRAELDIGNNLIRTLLQLEDFSSASIFASSLVSRIVNRLSNDVDMSSSSSSCSSSSSSSPSSPLPIMSQFYQILFALSSTYMLQGESYIQVGNFDDAKLCLDLCSQCLTAVRKTDDPGLATTIQRRDHQLKEAMLKLKEGRKKAMERDRSLYREMFKYLADTGVAS